MVLAIPQFCLHHFRISSRSADLLQWRKRRAWRCADDTELFDIPNEFEYSGLECLLAEVPRLDGGGIIHGQIKTESRLQCGAAEAASCNCLTESGL